MIDIYLYPLGVINQLIAGGTVLQGSSSVVRESKVAGKQLISVEYTHNMIYTYMYVHVYTVYIYIYTVYIYI